MATNRTEAEPTLPDFGNDGRWIVERRLRDRAQRFDEDAKARMLTDPSGFASLDAHRDYRSAAPTPDRRPTLCSQRVQWMALGAILSRPRGIGLLQCAHTPYVPSDIRRSA